MGRRLDRPLRFELENLLDHAFHGGIERQKIGLAGQPLAEMALRFIHWTQYEPPTLPACPSIDTSTGHILLLGHALKPDGQASGELLERMAGALLLHQKNPQLKIIASGGFLHPELAESDAMKNWLVAHGVDPLDILEENRSRDTVENIQFSMSILASLRSPLVCLATTSGHMERSFALLSEHCKKRKINIELARRAVESSSSNYQKNAERFLLFKDFGRIM